MNYYERQKLAKDRVIELGRQVWSLLTDDEKESYSYRGTLSFVEDIATIVGYDADYDDTTSVDDIHDQIITNWKEN